jgi:hypothetical protein
VIAKELARVLGEWRHVYRLATAYAEPGEAAEALEAAGIDVGRPHEGARMRDMVVVEGAVGDDWSARAARLATLATKAIVVVTPSGFATGARPIEAVAPKLWALGRVRERTAYAFAIPFAELMPSRLRLRFARREVFLVDVAPRTPQARLRRRLNQAP